MEKYAIDKVIGEGTYGIVYRATEKSSGDLVAIKKFKTVSDEQLSKREIQAISMLSHAYIVSYRHSFRHEGLLHLVFDYVPDSINKLLSRNRRGIKPAQAQRIVYQLCQALQYCHASRVIHRDVKPDNILLDESGDIRLCDFGVARTIQFEGDPLSDYVATRWYRPPEQELRMDRYSFDADMWSVGCVLVELLTGRPLFPGNTQIDQLNMIQEYLGPLPASMASRLPRGVAVVKKPSKSLEDVLKNRDLPDGTLDFITHTLQLEPKNRLCAAECLAHRFLKPLREAEQREQKTRQREEKQRRSKHLQVSGCPDSEDGIEEEIPGSRTQAEAKSPVRTPIYKSRASESPTPHHSEGKRSQQRVSKLSGENNPADGDSDDIQEIIEMDEMCLAEPLTPRGAKRSSHDEEKRSPSKASKAVRRRRGSENELHDGDPVEPAHHHECYEDDFED